jgi:hypothetical protein
MVLCTMYRLFDGNARMRIHGQRTTRTKRPVSAHAKIQEFLTHGRGAGRVHPAHAARRRRVRLVKGAECRNDSRAVNMLRCDKCRGIDKALAIPGRGRNEKHRIGPGIAAATRGAVGV